MTYSSATLAAQLGGTLHGSSRPVRELAPPERAKPDSIAVLADPQRPPANLQGTVVSSAPLPESPEYCTIVVPDTRLALAQLSQLFAPPPKLAEGRDPSAVVHPSAELDESVALGAHVSIGPRVRIGPGSQLAAGVVIGADVVIGAGCHLYPNVTLYPGVRLGNRVTIHSGAVIGADGFGYAVGPQGALKIAHLGGVIIEDDVEIGANSCVDRGTLSDTVIGARSKLDNLCQVGHNVTIGPDCLIAGMVGIAGSTRIGRGVVIGGGAGIGDHLTIGDGARIGGRAGVTKNVPAGESWMGYPAQPLRRYIRGLYLQGQLERIWRRIRELERA